MSKELEALEKIVDTYCIDNIDKEIINKITGQYP